MKTRYKIGDKFSVEAILEVSDIDKGSGGDVSYHVVFYVNDEDIHGEWLTQDELDEIVNPTAKLIRLQKEQEDIAKRIAKLEGKING